ncbi:MAG: site-specific DNA-methyltransferase [Proteobacteria bacterium]|nr:site-specific DNA-methyltransferase [Pseudomonadota bacterium]
MNRQTRADHLLAQLDGLNEQQLRRLLVEHLTRQKLGLYWESNLIERDAALNADIVLPRMVEAWCHTPQQSDNPNEKSDSDFLHSNLIIEGDNYDALRLLKATHAGKIRVIYIDPPYNTGNKDWVYNDRYVGANDRWRHSQWLEFLYRRLTLARDLLTTDGVIMVSINDENRARLELLMDEVFPGMRVGSFVWRSRTGGNDTKGAFFSDNHEHVLVYANISFRFSGNEKSYSMYKYQEGDRVFRLSDLTSPKDFRERPNTYYPIFDPVSNIYYPCNPQRVWAYASKDRIKEGQKIRGDTIEDLIKRNFIWFPPNQRIEIYENKEKLMDAIRRKDIPMSGNVPLLFEEMPDLDFWVGIHIGYGRPAFKRFKEGLKNENQPISSWLTPKQEAETVDENLNMPIVGTTEEGSKDIKAVMDDKAFPYPKPPSLLKTLLSQSTRPNDIVLDFFAGSGTTGQAVLELNAEDGGQRRFILCSNTEATAKEPEKNLCRDVCAERIRRVITGYGGKPGYPPEQGGEFAYLQLDKLEPADVPFEATLEHTYLLLGLKRLGGIRAMPEGKLKWLGRLGDCDVILCDQVNAKSIKALAAWPKQTGAARLAVYSPRPVTVREQLAALGVEANCYGLLDVLLRGQGGNV